MASTTTSSSSSSSSSIMAQYILRILAAIFTMASTIVIATAKQTIQLFGITFKAHFNDSSSLRFLLATDVAVSAFSLLSVIILYRSGKQSVESRFLLYIHDLVMMLLLMSGCSAASAVGYVGKYGEEKMGWFKVCDRVEKFCNQTTIALSLSFLAFFCYLALSVISTRKLMYDASAK